MTGLGLHMAPFSGLGVDAIFRRLGGGSWRISVSVSPGRWISRPGVRGNDVTWDATGTSSTIPSMGLDGTGSILSLWRCRGLVWVRRDHYHGSDRRSRLSLLSQSRGLFQPECPTFFNSSWCRNLRTSPGSTSFFILFFTSSSSLAL